jgi:large subunit ribosomal protein L32
MGRAHKKLPVINLINCSNCQELILPHHVCPKCGQYHGEQLLEVKE